MIRVWANSVAPGDLINGYQDYGPIAAVARNAPAKLPRWMRTTNAVTTRGIWLMYYFWERVPVTDRNRR